MCRKFKECEGNDAGHETRALGGTCSLPLSGAIGGDSLMKISKYLETHGWKIEISGMDGSAEMEGGMTR